MSFLLNALLVGITSNFALSGETDGMTASYVCQRIFSELHDGSKLHPLDFYRRKACYTLYPIMTTSLYYTLKSFMNVSSHEVLLGGIVVIVSAIGPKFHGFKPGRRRWILRVIKVRSTTSFRGEVKPSSPYRKVLRKLYIPAYYNIYFA
jgi:hypothetical protein